MFITLWYFALLGIAFILVELCLIQRFVLFLGAPVYSISAVIGSLLLAAGAGSMISNRLNPTKQDPQNRVVGNGTGYCGPALPAACSDRSVTTRFLWRENGHIHFHSFHFRPIHGNAYAYRYSLSAQSKH